MIKKMLSALFLVGLLLACEDIFEVEDISNEQILLLAPSDQSVVTTTQVSFNWEGISEAESYAIQIATPNFNNATQLVLDTLVVVDSTFIGTRLTKILGNNSYEWRVRAENSGFTTPYSTSSFSVQSAN